MSTSSKHCLEFRPFRFCILTHSVAPSPAFEGGVKKRRSELALSEVEGVNPEQAPAFMMGSRRVDRPGRNFLPKYLTLWQRIVKVSL